MGARVVGEVLDLLGKTLETVSKGKTSQAIKKLMGLAAKTGGKPNSSRFGPDGKLYLVDMTSNRVLRVDPVDLP